MSNMKTFKFYVEEHPSTGELIDGDIEFSLQASWAVCPDCCGRGTTYLGWPADQQPAFSREDFAEDPDFATDYMSGNYDKQCPCCKGRTTVLEVDWSQVDQTCPVIKAYLEHLEHEAEYQAVVAAERRMGA